MSLAPHKIRVGVLRGGPSPEYEVSLRTGSTILANLPEQAEPIDIFISKDGAWHTSGIEKKPERILRGLDLVWNAMHGRYGEDGTVQKLLEEFQIPYTGSNALASALGMNKLMAKNIFKRAGFKTPHHLFFEKDNREADPETIRNIYENLPFPVIIKPVDSGSSLGISVAQNQSELKAGLTKAFAHSPKILAEEFIDGKEVTCGVIENFRNKNIYTLLPVEIGRPKRNFYDYESKYNRLESDYRIPANLSEVEKYLVGEAAGLIHQALGLRHYSRADFIVHPKRGLFVLEVNTLPELTHRSSFVKSLETLGSNIKEFISHIIDKTLRK